MKKNKSVLELAKELQFKTEIKTGTKIPIEKAFILSYLEHSQGVKNYIVIDNNNQTKPPKNSTLIFESDKFKIFYKENPEFKDFVKTEKLQKRLAAVYDRFCEFNSRPKNHIPTITVGVLTYNQETYILECLQSIIAQTGFFKLKVIIIDDNSTDNTKKVIEDYLKNLDAPHREQINYIRNKKNVGVVKNYQKLINLIRESGCDYYSFCEGDDYYISANRLQLHLDCHYEHPEYISSFNKKLLYFFERNYYEISEPDFRDATISTEELILANHPGSFCTTFFSANSLKYIGDDLFEEMFTVDWMFNIFVSQFGDIGHINRPMSLYRIHNKGVWSGNNKADSLVVACVPEYNKYLNYLYDKEFQITQGNYIGNLFRAGCLIKKYDISFICSIFPNPLSNFSYQEFTNMLARIPRTSIYITGAFSKNIYNEPFENIVTEFKRNNPRIREQVFYLTHNTIVNSSLLYGIFLFTAYYNILPIATRFKIPFVFTLYPGGGFLLDNEESDQMLKEVFASPYFRKVIVTQKVTYDYLIKKHLCPKEKIEFIFGVVTDPKKPLADSKSKKFGVDKESLDICFVAHRYSKKGEDKGYDLFIDAAKKLSKKYDNINFHIVGPWKDALDVSGIKNITFYGSVLPDFFEGFFADKDIIVSANRPDILTNGAFDGFPTTSVTDASFNGVAMFCTDPLKLNQNRFIDKEEIVIIKPSVDDICEKIEYYYDNPKELRKIAKNGQAKTKKIYSDTTQIIPRIKLLNQEVENAKKNPITLPEPKPSLKAKIKKPLKKITPKIMRRAFRKAQRIIILIKDA